MLIWGNLRIVPQECGCSGKKHHVWRGKRPPMVPTGQHVVPAADGKGFLGAKSKEAGQDAEGTYTYHHSCRRFHGLC